MTHQNNRGCDPGIVQHRHHIIRGIGNIAFRRRNGIRLSVPPQIHGYTPHLVGKRRHLHMPRLRGQCVTVHENQGYLRILVTLGVVAQLSYPMPLTELGRFEFLAPRIAGNSPGPKLLGHKSKHHGSQITLLPCPI